MSSQIRRVCAALFLFMFPMLVLAQSASSSDEAATSTVTTVLEARTPAAIEARVRADFADAPVMIAIARCESKFRQYTDAGNVLYGGAGAGMVGVFQINAAVHAAYATSLGFNIKTTDGNLGYARFLYNKQGSDPWLSSFPCWSAAVNNPESNPANASALSIDVTGSLTANLSMGVIHSQVLTLQKMLNKMGYTIALDGPGSIGNETTKFGALTRTAVRRFQCAKNIICSGDEGSTGYGYVGARTRAALIAALPGVPTVESNTGGSAQDEKEAKKATLQAQIAQYQKLIAELQAQIDAL